MRRGGLFAPLLAGLLGTWGCAHRAPGLPDAVVQTLEAHPSAYLAGPIAGAALLQTLNRKDFVYDIALDRAAQRVALSRLAAKSYRIALFAGAPDLLRGPPRPLADTPVNVTDFDVESLAFSPDGQRLAVASRDASVRLLDAQGKLIATYATEEPLVSLAFSPDGRYVVAGSERGLLTVLGGDNLAYGHELRAHADEVRALDFADDGTLWSGSWDKLVRSYRIAVQTRALTEVRVHYARQGAVTVFAARLGGAPVRLALDERSPMVTLSPEAARAAGIEPTLLTDRIKQITPAGPMELPLARDRTLVFKDLRAEHVDLAICQSCQPAGADGTLGQSFLARYELVLDESTQEVVLRLRDPASAPKEPVPVLVPGARFAMPGYVQDLTVDRAGDRLGVALGESKAQRSLAIYQREKRGVEEPQRPGDVAAIVDARSGTILEQHGQHHGIVSTAAISPDGQSLASGGWDKKVFLYSGRREPVAQASYGWSVRRVRFSPDGRLLAVAAWTPQNAHDADSDPAAQLFRIEYARAEVRDASPPSRAAGR